MMIPILRARAFVRSGRHSFTRYPLRAQNLSTTAIRSAQRFVVYAPDKKDEGAAERRLSVRPAHIEGAQANIASGLTLLAGALVTPESVATPTSEKKMIGSVCICEAESINDVRKMVESDVYYTAGVWDAEKIVILPYIT